MDHINKAKALDTSLSNHIEQIEKLVEESICDVIYDDLLDDNVMFQSDYIEVAQKITKQCVFLESRIIPLDKALEKSFQSYGSIINGASDDDIPKIIKMAIQLKNQRYKSLGYSKELEFEVLVDKKHIKSIIMRFIKRHDSAFTIGLLLFILATVVLGSIDMIHRYGGFNLGEALILSVAQTFIGILWLSIINRSYYA